MIAGKRLAVLLERVSGIVVQERDLPRISDLAQRRARLHGFRDTASYLAALRRDTESPEWREILSHVTINESSLFRAPRQFEVLVDTLIPGLISDRQEPLKIWSAGCARGEETATLAIVLSEIPGLGAGKWDLLGTDVDEGSLEIARRGLYSKRSVRKVAPELLQRYFAPVGDSFQLVRSVRSRIRYSFMNLIDTPYDAFDRETRFDVIFLRNVLIYFRRESQKRVLAEMARRLAPGGVLFVGPSESLWQVSPHFVAEDCGGCFVHRLRQSQPSHPATNDRSTPGRTGSAADSARDTNGVRGDGTTEESGRQRWPAPPKEAAEDPLVHVRLALTAAREGRKDETLKALRAAAYLEPRLFQVRYLMARSFEAGGWVRRARSEFRAVAALLAAGDGLVLSPVEFSEVPSRAEVEQLCRQAISDLAEPRPEAYQSTST